MILHDEINILRTNDLEAVIDRVPAKVYFLRNQIKYDVNAWDFVREIVVSILIEPNTSALVEGRYYGWQGRRLFARQAASIVMAGDEPHHYVIDAEQVGEGHKW